MPLTPKLISSPERERWLNKHVPYRIQILRGLEAYNASGGPDGLMRHVFPNIFESTLMACRWTMSFLGLRFTRKTGMLREVTKRREETDIFSIDLGGTLIEPTKLPQSDLDLLGTVFKAANVGSAHPGQEGAHSMTPEQVGPAAILLISKTKVHLYDILGRPVPTWKG